MGCEAKGLGGTWGKREPPQVHIVRECLHDSMMRALMPFLRASWKPLCTHTCSMASKQQELEVCVWLQGCSLVVGHRDVVGLLAGGGQSAAGDGCRHFGEDRLGERSGPAAVREQQGCMKLWPGMDWEPVWSRWSGFAGFGGCLAADCLIRKK